MPEAIESTTRTLITTAASVRALTGATGTQDADDPAVEGMIQRAMSAVLREVASRVDNLVLDGTPDGSRRTFRIPRTRAATMILDQSLNLATDGDDVNVYLRTNGTGTDFPTWTSASITSLGGGSVDGLHGIVTLDSAPAATVDAVEFSGYLVARVLDKQHLVNAVEYHAAHQLQNRILEPGKNRLANPNLAKQQGAAKDERNWWAMYLNEVARLKSPIPRSVSRRTSLPEKRSDNLRESGLEWL